MRIGIDLGGTKIAGVVLDGAGQERARRRVPTPQGDYAGTLAAVAGVVEALEADVGRAGLPVGIGTPGTLDPDTELLRGCNSTCLNDRPFAADLRARLRRRLALANDANCLALSEAVDGAGAGAIGSSARGIPSSVDGVPPPPPPVLAVVPAPLEPPPPPQATSAVVSRPSPISRSRFFICLSPEGVVIQT